MLTEIQKITLRDVLRDKGLPERRIEDIFLLLRFKPQRAQLAFYYVSQGFTHSQAAQMVGVERSVLTRTLRRNCADIHDYLQSPVH